MISSGLYYLRVFKCSIVQSYVTPIRELDPGSEPQTLSERLRAAEAGLEKEKRLRSAAELSLEMQVTITCQSLGH